MADIEMNYYNGSSYEKIYPLGCCKIRTVTLASGSWSNLRQTVSVPGVVAGETNQKITVAPSSSSRDNYETYGVKCISQSSGNLTFSCNTRPSVNLTVYVTLEEVTSTT